MKKQRHLIFSLLLAGCVALNACGKTDADPEDRPEEAAQETEDAGEAPDTAQTVPNGENAEADAGEDETAFDPPDNTQEQFSGEAHSVTGIVIDAATDFLSLQTPEGNTYYLTIPETGVTGNLRSITVGEIVNLSYRGSLDESHALLSDISASSMVTGIYTEEYAFAIKIMNAVRDMSVDGIRELINFPLFIDTGTYAGPMNDDVFRYMDSDELFTEELVDRIANYNLFGLSYTRAGFVMGEGGPNITFGVDDEGILGITGINCTKMPASGVSGNSSP